MNAEDMFGQVSPSLTESQRKAIEWLKERGGDAIFDRNGIALAMGESAPFTRSTWNALAALGMVEFYKPTGKGRGRLRVKHENS